MTRSVPVLVRLIGLLQVLFGGLVLLFALAVTLATVAEQLGLTRSSDNWMFHGPEVRVFLLVIAAFVASLGGLSVATGAALCRGRAWARSVVVGLSLLQALVALASFSLLPALLPLGIASYLGLNENVARAFRA